MKITERLLVLLLLTCLGGGVGAGAGAWQRAEPGFVWEFPRDHAAHRDYSTEWWYFTGHLVAVEDRSRRLGFQLTIFKIGLSRERGEGWASGSALMGHAAITDESAGTHRFSEVLYRENGFLARFGDPGEALLAECRGPAGTEQPWRLHWTGDAFEIEMADRRQGFAYELRAVPVRPMVFHGRGGYSPKSDEGDAASLYYSYTRLATAGHVTLDGERFEVDGLAWMDKEISSEHLDAGQIGWDWMSLQLDDGRDLMLFELRDADGGSDFVDGTLVAADGTSRRLEQIALRPGRRWRSRESGSDYPVAWEIDVEGQRLRIEATLDAQENVGRQHRVHYWEGSVRVFDDTGRAIGRGFLEMTGYGEDARPPI